MSEWQDLNLPRPNSVDISSPKTLSSDMATSQQMQRLAKSSIMATGANKVRHIDDFFAPGPALS